MSVLSWLSVALCGPASEQLEALDHQLDALRAQWSDRSWAELSPEEVDTQLKRLRKIDQLVRKTQPPAGWPPEEREALQQGVAARMQQIDTWSTGQVSSMLDTIGWPTLSVHGSSATLSAWLLVQHADQDVALQRRALAALGPLAASGEFPVKHHAYLVDRVATNEGRAQTYGTQGRCGEDGLWQPNPVIEPEGLEARRAGVGLGTMAEYQDRFDCAGHRIRAMQQLEAGEHAACRQSFLALAQTKATPSGRAPLLYNAACCAALSGDRDGAFSLLTRALADGFDDREQLASDPDLAPLRADPRWAELARPR